MCESGRVTVGSDGVSKVGSDGVSDSGRVTVGNDGVKGRLGECKLGQSGMVRRNDAGTYVCGYVVCGIGAVKVKLSVSIVHTGNDHSTPKGWTHRV